MWPMTNPTSGDPGQPSGPNYDAGPSDWASAPIGDSPFAGSWTTGPVGSGEPADRFAASPGGYAPDPYDVPPPPRRRGNGVLIGGAVAVVAVLAIGVGAFVFFGSNDSTDSANGNSTRQGVQEPPDNPVITIAGSFPTVPDKPVPLEIGDPTSAEFTSSADTLLIRDPSRTEARTYVPATGTLGKPFPLDVSHCDPTAIDNRAVCVKGDEVRFVDLASEKFGEPVKLQGLTDVLVTADAAFAGGRDSNTVWIADITPGASVPARKYDSPGPGCNKKDEFLYSAGSFVSFGGILINPSTGKQIDTAGRKVLGVGSVALLQPCGNDHADIQIVNRDGMILFSHAFGATPTVPITQPTTTARNDTSAPTTAPSTAASVPANPKNPSATTGSNESTPTPAVLKRGDPVSSNYVATVIGSDSRYAIGADVFNAADGTKVWSEPGGKAVTHIVDGLAVVNDGTAIHLYSAADGKSVRSGLPAPDGDSTIIYDGQQLLVTHDGALNAITLQDGTTPWPPLTKGKVTPTAGGLVLAAADGTQYFATTGQPS
ncbi:hypothetical protein [Antrihabitans stalactiti]|uniref:Uncharacterized protein n=1 Tax=Antrihabitans stalactiti TaxID=2584121 RepID=A0A848KC02_9NOCA|nr:hypothetical protein [Antrihabitans stalactiti]NMN95058.1 hypothetical protein [Antrihabitans stalactiti]